jgi:2-polyprenyl-3-methyl-5-hydroxy-6-metoxy-1,4-benzoquinol methylase
MSYECRICGNKENNQSYFIREMYFGSRDQFEYFECSKCGCLQIKEYPANIAKYYPENYGSFKPRNLKKPNSLIRYLRYKKLKHVLNEHRNLVGFFLNIFIKPGFEQKMLPGNIKSTSEILDIGSGAGALLLNLRNKGFKNITGSDIFINNDIIYDEHLRILKKSIYELTGQYDFIMLNHAFEHMPDQEQVLNNLHRLIKPGHVVMIRIPVKNDFIWERYGVNWGSLHAPNHYYLHTVESMKILAEKSHFSLVKTSFDSGIYQFYSSEQFIKGIPLYSENSYHINHSKGGFTKKDIKQFRRMTKKLNKTGKGDAACFYLKHVSSN